MKNKTALLVALQLSELFPINKLKYSRDKTEKRRVITILLTMILVSIVGVGYSFAIAYGYAYLGLSEVLPALMVTVTSIVVLFTTFFKSNGVLFGFKDYDMIMSLPVKSDEVIKSRFLAMYIFDFIFVCLVMIPTAVVCAIFNVTSAEFYIMFLISLFIIPLLPMVIAATVGAVIMMISTRYRFKNIITIILSFTLLLGIMSLSFNMNSMNKTKVTEISTQIVNNIYQVYPIAKIYNEGLINSNIASYGLFVVISIVVYIFFVKLISLRYSEINTALTTSKASGTYKVRELKESSPLLAMYKKELRRYFSSSIYVVNTLFGAIMLLGMAIAICFISIDKLEIMMEAPGLGLWINKGIPFVEAFMIITCCTTASSISLEGKNKWILSSLPLESKTIFGSKIAVNLTITLPAVVISGILLIIGLHADFVEAINIFVTPTIYAFFSAVIGIFINLKFPNFQWVNETAVIKQGASTLITMIIGFISAGIPVVIIMALTNININLSILIIDVILIAITLLIYLNNNKQKI